MAVRLSPHFTEEELRVNDCTPLVKRHAAQLCKDILEPIRERFGKPMRITSGYRSRSHNEAVGGSDTSFHLYEGYRAAADFDIPGVPIDEVFEWIREESLLPVDQVILEYTHGIADIIHVQIDLSRKPRQMALIGETAGNLGGKKKGYRRVAFIA